MEPGIIPAKHCWKTAASLVITLSFLCGIVIPSNGLDEVNHDIVFEGNDSFTSTYVRSGTGSSADPYIVSDLDMGTYNIQIKNTSKHLVLRNVTFSNSDSWALFLYNADNIMIENVTTINRSRVVYGYILNDVMFVKCNFSSIRYSLNSFEFISCSSVTIQDSSFSEKVLTGAGRIHYSQGTGHRFFNNTCTGVAYEDLRFHSNGLIANSTFMDSQVTVQDGNMGSMIVNNHFDNSNGDALRIVSSYRLVISRNYFHGTNGIYFDSLAWQSITTPQVIDNNTFESCGVGLNTEGTYLTRLTYTHILYNYFGNCTSYAIVLNNGMMNRIWRNIFYHNAGTDNSTSGPQATQNYYSSYYENKWTVGSIGNFWANHRQPDLDNNGIVDINYTIPSNGLDTRPSTNPYFDTAGPIVTITEPSSGAYPRSYVRATWTATDAGSGISGTMLSLNGGPFINIDESMRKSLFLEKGSHDIRVRAYDLAGLYGEDSVSVLIPETEDVLNFEHPIDGEYNSTSMYRITWSVMPYFVPENLSLKVDGVLTYLPPDSRAATRPLDEGPHTLRLTVRDDDGLQLSKTSAFIIDVTPPQIFIVSPQPGSVISNNYVTFNITVEDNYGLDRVEVCLDEGPYIDRTGISQFSDLLPDGPHIMKIRAFDLAGSVTNVSLSIHIGGDTGIDIIEPPDRTATRNGSVLLKWDYSGRFPWSRSFVKIGKGALADIWGAREIEVPLPEDGEYPVSVRLQDDDGNYIERSITVIRDTKPPLVDFLSPGEDSVINTTTLKVAWTSRDQFGQVVRDLKLSVDDGPALGVGNSTSIDLTLDPGSHRLKIEAIDPAGNSAEKELFFFIDIEPPVVEINSPADGEILKDSSVMITWKAFDDHLLKNLTLVVDNRIFLDVLGRTSYFATLGMEGDHVISLIGSDLAGNLVNRTILVIVDMHLPDLGWVTEPVGFVKENWFNISWTAFDRNGIANLSLEFDGTAVYLDPEASYMNLTLGEGEYTFTLRALDRVGWEWFISSSGSLVIDLTPPVLTIDLERSSLSGNNAVVYWSAKDTVSGIASTMVDIDGEGFGMVTTGNFYKFEGLEEGKHTITLRTMDRAGNSAEGNWSFVVGSGGGGQNDNDGSTIPFFGILAMGLVGVLLVFMIIGIIISRRRSRKHEDEVVKKPKRMGISIPAAPLHHTLPPQGSYPMDLPPATGGRIETTEEGAGYIRPAVEKRKNKPVINIGEDMVPEMKTTPDDIEIFRTAGSSMEGPMGPSATEMDNWAKTIVQKEDVHATEGYDVPHTEENELSHEVPVWDEDMDQIPIWGEAEDEMAGQEVEEIPDWDDVDDLEELEEMDEIEDREE
ncbi:MAG: right-handed parallel beta-helix repeat-containing protein [Candidatus Thermoplasmatota archaeon]|nr:right-handed parallel beta-helix repeat-containing protein [Candidatus Thermoplasmatota archaeon]